MKTDTHQMHQPVSAGSQSGGSRRKVADTSERSGFTLVEMLVAVALVLLMMSLFASIFSMASTSVSVQRGISRMDQKARSLTTLIRTDLEHRTMRFPFPFAPDENGSVSLTPFGERAGYLYISTNDPDSGLDDLIQFTVSSEMLREDTDSSPYFGRAAFLPGGGNLAVNPNQPEADDGVMQSNGSGSSTAAEVCYFVRGGNLYRRMTLLRNPLPVAGSDLDEQPTTSGGEEYFTSRPNGAFVISTLGGNLTTDDFYTWFDYSAFREESNLVPEPDGAELVGVSALNNDLDSNGAGNVALGQPRYRFGFNQITGLSREHTAVGGFFLGRFTHAETSAANFNWPQRPAHIYGDSSTNFGNGGNPDGNPFNIANVVNLQANGVVAEFANAPPNTIGRGGSRRMEDLVMTGVHEMKIEIWDQRLQKYTTPGHTETVSIAGVRLPGDYHTGLRYADSSGFGPEGSSVGVFDTWHPEVDRNGSPQNDFPPVRVYRYIPPTATMDGTLVNESLRALLINAPDRITGKKNHSARYGGGATAGLWQPNRSYQADDVIFSYEDINGNGVFNPGVDKVNNDVVYRATRSGASSPNPQDAPNFPITPGARVREANGNLDWEALDNRVPLQSIRITLRLHDVTTDSLRNLSLIIPLTDQQ